MTKKILSVLAMMSIAAMMMLSSCDTVNTDNNNNNNNNNNNVSLIGKWENEKDGVKTTVEITADDKLTVTAKYDGKTVLEIKGTIKSVKDHEVTYEVDGKETKIEYSDLGCDTVKFGDVEYKKVDDIGTETGTNTDFSLIGKWEYSKEGFTTIVEITADDKLIIIGKYEVDGKKMENKTEYTITEVSDKEIFYESNNQEFKVAYSDLSRDTVKFGDNEYKKVDDIGTETGTNTDFSLIGKWEYSREGYTQIIEITADDKLIVIGKYEIEGKAVENKMEGTIKSVKDHKITYEYNGTEFEVEYSDLGSDTVKFGDVEYKKVY